jgi:zinc transport system substrate-binding protein
MNKQRTSLIIVGLLLLAGLALLMGTRTAAPSLKMQVVATFYPLYDFAKEIGGDKIDVTNITPAGSEPHDYEPTPQQLVAAQKAGVFIYSGATMEPWVQKFLAEYKGLAVNAGARINLRHNGTSTDPHYWLDPVLAKAVVEQIHDGLMRADPLNMAYYSRRRDDYIVKLNDLNRDIADGIERCQKRIIITSHDAFGYFADRYHVTVKPIAGLSPDQEPSPPKLAELATVMRQENINYVFFEKLVSPRLAQTLADETGAKTVVFDTIEGVTNDEQKQGKDYLSIQRDNLRSLRAALACQ